LGAVLYRAGRYEEAAARLDEAIQAQGKGGAVGTWLFLAMARQRLGQQEEARQCLKTALAGFEEALPQDAARWTTRLELQTLRREAEDLLAAPRR
jgi:Tfp pilus assembly protein PilF